MLGDEPTDGLFNRTSQVNGGCFAADGRKMDVAFMRMAMTWMMEDDKEKDKEGDDDEPKEQMPNGRHARIVYRSASCRSRLP
ncbi:MAG: hypothetical protein R3C03_00885 [Pirellulaceae bacterium]